MYVYACMYIHNMYIYIYAHVYMEVCKIRCTYVQEKTHPKQQKWRKNTTKNRLIFKTKINWFLRQTSIDFFSIDFWKNQEKSIDFFQLFCFDGKNQSRLIFFTPGAFGEWQWMIILQTGEYVGYIWIFPWDVMGIPPVIIQISRLWRMTTRLSQGMMAY